MIEVEATDRRETMPGGDGMGIGQDKCSCAAMTMGWVCHSEWAFSAAIAWDRHPSLGIDESEVTVHGNSCCQQLVLHSI